MYDRSVGSRTLTFSVSGKLWEKSLVMQDRETSSLWSQIVGKCMQGEMLDRQLSVIPSVITDLKNWRDKYPTSTITTFHVLSLAYQKKYYEDRLDRFLIGLAVAGKARAWTFDQLALQPVVNDEFAGRPLVIMYNPDSRSAAGFHRLIGGQVLNFRHSDGEIRDLQTDSLWDSTRGVAVAGPLAGKYLAAEPVVVSFIETWTTYYPETQFWKAKK